MSRRIITSLARGFALSGGALLCLVAVLVAGNILSRVILARSIPGGFEVVAICTAISIFLCLPYCHMQRGNIIVDLFIGSSAAQLTRWLDAFAAIIYGVIAALFAWRMMLGMRDAVHYQDISVIAGIPLWWAYPPAIASFGLLALCCAVTARYDLSTARR